ncbi:remorin-like [Solanum dulcamara]|uniref:remorin-like n=1 Tax=Solanum dulcamara TaxID=45834 RepID=UPI002486645D|nr:remorin-like [Solanum dulcamara]
MGEEESSPPVSPQNYEHKNEEPKEKVEENALSLVPTIHDKEKISSPVQKKETDSGIQKSIGGSKDRDTALAKVELQKRLALIKAWEDNEKTKAENKALKKLSAVGSWENTKKATIEAELRQIQEELEKKKAEYAEKMKNKMAEIHREAEEKRAMIKAKQGEDVLKVEETAAKFRATGNLPKKFLACFGY